MSIGLDTYGYPKICFMGKNEHGSWVRVSQGWFFPREHDDEPACYFDININDQGKVVLELNWLGIISFDFVTPLDDYTLSCCPSMTIGDYYKKYGEKA